MSDIQYVLGKLPDIQYVLGERTTFSYYNTSPREIIYYKGRLIIEDKLVSFVCFDDLESAVQVRRCSIHVNHSRVLKARFYTYDASIKKHLVCFDRFDGFLPQADQKFLARLKAPICSYEVPGNPDEIVQCEIRELSMAFEHMHSVGVSSSWLNLPVGYVWSERRLKIIMVDLCSKDYDSKTWKMMLAEHIKLFGDGLNDYFLKTTDTDFVWPEKVSFMRCFRISVQLDRRLRMIYDHPFLENDMMTILDIFPKVHRALRSSDHGRLQLTKLMAALNSKQFKSEFMPNGVWTRPEMSPEFDAFLRGKRHRSAAYSNLDNSVKYNTKDMGELLRCLRNLSHNYYKSGMTMHFVFNEVRRYWPHLMDRFHEKLAG